MKKSAMSVLASLRKQNLKTPHAKIQASNSVVFTANAQQNTYYGMLITDLRIIEGNPVKNVFIKIVRETDIAGFSIERDMYEFFSSSIQFMILSKAKSTSGARFNYH